jgi:hypothetical protein
MPGLKQVAVPEAAGREVMRLHIVWSAWVIAISGFCGACGSSPDGQIASQLGIKTEEVRRMHRRKSLTDDVLKRLDRGELNEIRREMGPPDLPRRRAAFLRLQMRSTGGTPSGSNLFDSIQRLRSLRIPVEPRGRAMALPRALAILPRLPARGPAPERSQWVSLGPSNIGGRTRAILVDPTRPDRVWAASVGGGVWRSDDGGTTFMAVDEFMENLAVCCLAIDPQHPDTV